MAKIKYTLLPLSVGEVRELLEQGKVKIMREIKSPPPLTDKTSLGMYEKKGGRLVYGLMHESQRWPCPFGKPGEKLFVQEDWAYDETKKTDPLVFKIDYPDNCGIDFNPAKTMPYDYTRFAVIKQGLGVKVEGGKVFWWAMLIRTIRSLSEVRII